jgi:uncharacterized protein YbjQ (UPF0145 family)
MTNEITSDLRSAIEALGKPPKANERSTTSDLSIDETLLLHGMGYEPTDLVTGISVISIPYGTFITPYGQGQPVELPAATHAVNEAFRIAAQRIESECAKAEGIGVVGVEVEVEISGRTTTIALTGTAIQPIDRKKSTVGRPFVTDLSVQDFVLLERAGWAPIDLVVGASFVAAPMQSVRNAISQVRQNIELPIITKALQTAREQAMEMMQAQAIACQAAGVVDVSIMDGPLGHSKHVCTFICYGTAIRLVADQHLRIEPELVLPLDDNIGFEATAIRS